MIRRGRAIGGRLLASRLQALGARLLAWIVARIIVAPAGELVGAATGFRSALLAIVV
jgi:hypothetical protein